jgi:hypothetical protein
MSGSLVDNGWQQSQSGLMAIGAAPTTIGGTGTSINNSSYPSPIIVSAPQHTNGLYAPRSNSLGGMMGMAMGMGMGAYDNNNDVSTPFLMGVESVHIDDDHLSRLDQQIDELLGHTSTPMTLPNGVANGMINGISVADLPISAFTAQSGAGSAGSMLPSIESMKSTDSFGLPKSHPDLSSSLSGDGIMNGATFDNSPRHIGHPTNLNGSAIINGTTGTGAGITSYNNGVVPMTTSRTGRPPLVRPSAKASAIGAVAAGSLATTSMPISSEWTTFPPSLPRGPSDPGDAFGPSLSRPSSFGSFAAGNGSPWSTSSVASTSSTTAPVSNNGLPSFATAISSSMMSNPLYQLSSSRSGSLPTRSIGFPTHLLPDAAPLSSTGSIDSGAFQISYDHWNGYHGSDIGHHGDGHSSPFSDSSSPPYSGSSSPEQEEPPSMASHNHHIGQHLTDTAPFDTLPLPTPQYHHHTRSSGSGGSGYGHGHAFPPGSNATSPSTPSSVKSFVGQRPVSVKVEVPSLASVVKVKAEPPLIDSNSSDSEPVSDEEPNYNDPAAATNGIKGMRTAPVVVPPHDSGVSG